MTAQEILTMIEKTKERNKKYYVAFGIRGDSREFSIGDELPCSQNMVDDLYDPETQSYPLLDGTCAIGFGYLWFDGENEDLETIEKAVNQCKKIYGYEHTYLIAGPSSEHGDDENEIIITDAEVICEI